MDKELGNYLEQSGHLDVEAELARPLAYLKDNDTVSTRHEAPLYRLSRLAP
jgi:hypothetical protein